MSVDVRPGNIEAAIAALGYTPATANTVTIAAGTVSLPGLTLANDISTGFYDVEDGDHQRGGRVLGWAQSGQLLLTGAARQDASGGNNALFRFGDGQAIPDVAIDTYVATLTPRTVDFAGTASTAIGFNIGSWRNRLTNGLTYTQPQAMVELDKIDYEVIGNDDGVSGSGTATINFTGGLRVRAPVPHRGVTQVEAYSYTVVAPHPIDTGWTNTYYGYYHPKGANTAADTVYGIFFREAPSGAAIASADAQELRIVSGATGTTQADITLNGRNHGSKIKLQVRDLTVFRADCSGPQQNFISLDANNTPTFRVRSDTNAVDVGMDFVSLGGSGFSFHTGEGEQVRINSTPSADRYLQLTGSNGGNPTISTSAGAVAIGRLLLTTASASDTAGFRLPPGSAPTSPVDGDVWTTAAGMFIQINGVTKTVVTA